MNTMMNVAADTRPITLVCAHPRKASLSWNPLPDSESRIVHVRSLAAVHEAIANATTTNVALERVIMDGTITAVDFLTLLAALPLECSAEIVMIAQDGSAFLSARSRGGERVLYPLSFADVRFYVDTYDLVGATTAAIESHSRFRRVSAA